MAKGKFSQPRNRGKAVNPAPQEQTRQFLPEEELPLEALIPEEPIPAFIPEVNPAPIPEFIQPEVDPQVQAFSDAILEADRDLPEPEGEDDEPTFLEKAMAFFRQNQKMVLVGACALVLVLIIGAIAAVFISSAADPYDGKILNNVTIAGVHVGGMTRSEAEDTVAKNLASAYGSDMVIALPDETIRLSPADTGVSLDIKAARLLTAPTIPSACCPIWS